MDYKDKKKQEMAIAERAIEGLNHSSDKYVVYRTSRPITDIKHMIETSTALYGDNVAFRQRFEKDKPYQEITYKQALEDINGFGHYIDRKRITGKENCNYRR